MLDHMERTDGGPGRGPSDLSWYTDHGDNNTERFHYRIHVDHSYPFQSSARVSVWSITDMEWHIVATMMAETVKDLDGALEYLEALREAIVP